MWAKYRRASVADGGGFRLQILRFFQTETQNYAWMLRSVPTEHMLAKQTSRVWMRGCRRQNSWRLSPKAGYNSTFKPQVLSRFTCR